MDARQSRNQALGMASDVFVHLLPRRVSPQELRGGTAVVIDVLRASTTIVHALAAGANAVVPCESVEQARQRAQETPGEVLLGGEREGEHIEGFDLDNSPLAYTPERVGGRTVIFTTTNGTRALLRCAHAGRILVGAWTNFNSLVEMLMTTSSPIHLVCAGTNAKVTTEDVLCAGAVVAAVAQQRGTEEDILGEARIAMEFFEGHAGSREEFEKAVSESPGGRNLKSLGFDADIHRACQWDLFDIVPEFSPGTGRIEPAAGFTATGRRFLAAPQ